MTLTPAGYRPRIIDKKIEKYLKIFGAVSVEGPKWCGKTWAVLNQANSMSYLMDEDTKLLTDLNLKSALEGDAPHGIDEWQEVPAIWDAVRFAVDQSPEKGKFLLTGSVSPPKSEIKHSGIGRIAGIRMHTLSLYESGYSSGKISLSDLFDAIDIEPEPSVLDIDELINIACRGGWPSGLLLDLNPALEIPISYFNSITSSEIKAVGKTVRSIPKFEYLLGSLARNNATTVKNATLHNDVQGAKGAFAADTLSAYLQILRDLYILEEIPGWHPRIRSKARMFGGPKRFFTDPSIAIAALGASPAKIRSELQTFGGIFEGLCLRDLLIYADAQDARVFHYRDNSLLEADAIIEKRDGSWSAFEIKLNKKLVNEGAANLLALKAKIEKDGGDPPQCMAVLTGTGIAMKRDDGVYVVPITMLKD